MRTDSLPEGLCPVDKKTGPIEIYCTESTQYRIFSNRNKETRSEIILIFLFNF